MQIIDSETKTFVCEVITNGTRTIDEILKLMDIAVDDEGQLYDELNQKYINAWYDNLITID
jgi:hypothetical protein